MEWSDAVGILQDMGRGCLDDDGLKPLLRDFYACAVRYSHLRAEWALADADARKVMDHPRRLSHNALIDSVNILSRNMQARGKDIDWRARLGDDRVVVGDLACYCAAVLGLVGSMPFRAEMWPFAEE
jgi:hypothetical protein